MKTSNLVILIALGVLFLLAMSFQFSLSNYVRKVADPKYHGELTKRSYDLAEFQKIAVQGDLTVYFKQDSVFSIEIEAPSNLLDHIEVSVQEDELRLGKLESFKGNDSITAFVSSDKLEGLFLASGAYLKTVSQVEGNDLRLKFEANSDGMLHLSYENVECKAASGSHVQLQGKMGSLSFGNQ